ncbi:hypothetical protein [Salinibacter ruber]|uniref:hypothetical protein n=1 Tax=Salinibacter ruber TaxID=146919 RepID=UPI0020737FC4|nr:hypothetical protein [Salinibacter ruber]
MPILPYFEDVPCGINDGSAKASLREKISTLQENLVRIPSGSPDDVIDTFLDSYKELRSNGYDVSPNSALACLFDLLVSAKYAERLVSDDGWTYCAGHDIDEGPSLYFSYLKTCPRCSVSKGIKPKVDSNKPKSGNIGDISEDSNYQIFRHMISSISSDVKIGKDSRTRSDIDVVIYNDERLILGETKSSPLVLYPLEIQLDRRLTEVSNGESVEKTDHTPATKDVMSNEIYMFVPHRDERISLGSANSGNWPYGGINDYIDEPLNIKFLIDAWNELYDVYKSNPYADEDLRRYILCGNGASLDDSSTSIDDSKNKPGMDRTDDIKKGTYQSLKYGTYFKEKSENRKISAVISTNMFPLRTYKRYLAEMVKVVWTKEEYSQNVNINLDDSDIRAFKKSDLFYLYDAIIGLSESIYMDKDIKSLVSIDEYMSQ